MSGGGGAPNEWWKVPVLRQRSQKLLISLERKGERERWSRRSVSGQKPFTPSIERSKAIDLLGEEGVELVDGHALLQRAVALPHLRTPRPIQWTALFISSLRVLCAHVRRLLTAHPYPHPHVNVRACVLRVCLGTHEIECARVRVLTSTRKRGTKERWGPKTSIRECWAQNQA